MRNKAKITSDAAGSSPLPEARLYELQADICQTLANAKRLQILNLLKDGEMSVGDMVKSLGVAKPNLSQHLAVMRQKGILAVRREGTTIYYRLATPRIIAACGIMRQVLAQILAERGSLSQSLAALDPDRAGLSQPEASD
uniref:ArsR family transcriptional regulator n=1 Tax=Desulfobacca acetoxidans TaxID=60893 RepID=A0A7C3Z2F5_9BACT